MSSLLSSTLRPFIPIESGQLGEKDEDELPSVVLATLVVLLLLLAALIWIAFCMAVHRTARRMAIFKRQRRTQNIIAAAISRAVSEGNGRPTGEDSTTPTTFSLFVAAQGANAELPTYEEALSMEAAPPPISLISAAPQCNPRNAVVEPPAYVRDNKINRVVRIAPERPGVSSSVCPPSYEYSTRPASSSFSSSSHLPSRVYTMPRGSIPDV